MRTSNYSGHFKRDAVQQIKVRGNQVREVSERLGVSTHSLYKWIKLYGESSPKHEVDHDAGNRRLKRELVDMYGPSGHFRNTVSDGFLDPEVTFKSVFGAMLDTSGSFQQCQTRPWLRQKISPRNVCQKLSHWLDRS